MGRWEAFVVKFCVRLVPMFLHISGNPPQQIIYSSNNCLAVGAGKENMAVPCGGNGNPDDRIDIVVFRLMASEAMAFPMTSPLVLTIGTKTVWFITILK